ncbi:hypothetical protein C8R42DRAFT_638790 [Lentinula raphanica]|nr:hypothetical protein C8R42DRAFT_638790 [Lentinula raphanica]
MPTPRSHFRSPLCVVTTIFKSSWITHQKLKEAAGKLTVKNWPLKEFKSPGSINVHADLTVLFNAWNTGTTYFHKMSGQEYNDWEASGYGELDVLAEGVREGGVNGQAGASVENSVTPSARPPSPASPSAEQSDLPTASSSGTFVFTQMVTDANGVAVSTTKRL